MKKTILSIAFALTFGLMYASASSEVKSVNYQSEFAPEGICTVYIYNDEGEVIYTESSYQPNASACWSWAEGRIWSFLSNPSTGVE